MQTGTPTAAPTTPGLGGLARKNRGTAGRNGGPPAPTQAEPDSIAEQGPKALTGSSPASDQSAFASEDQVGDSSPGEGNAEPPAVIPSPQGAVSSTKAAGPSSQPRQQYAAAVATPAHQRKTETTTEFKPLIDSDVRRRLDQEANRKRQSFGKVLIDAVRWANKNRILEKAFTPEEEDPDDPFADTGVPLWRADRAASDTAPVSFRITKPQRQVILNYSLHWSAINGYEPDEQGKLPLGAITPGRICTAILDAYLPPLQQQTRRPGARVSPRG